MPRNRSARAAVLGSVSRPPSAPSPSRFTPALRRRAIASALVLVSLLLLTVYFRESSGGGLHGLQGTGASILRPFEVAAERIARPFRDGTHWVRGLTSARSDAKRYRREADELRKREIQNKTILDANAYLKAILRYEEGPSFPADFRPVNAAVIVRAPSDFEQQVMVAAGSSSGIRRHDPVVTPDGLVGEVTKVTSRVSQVTLLTDAAGAVSALDLRTHADGIVRHRESGGQTLVLERVSKDQMVRIGDVIITAGWRKGNLTSIYPKGVPIGAVTSVSQVDTDIFKQVQIEPFAKFSSLESVIVLVNRARARTSR